MAPVPVGTDLPLGGKAKMAEQVKRRVNAARIAVAFAAAGVIAGAAATATGAPARGELPNNSIGTQEVKNDSLLWKDFKEGEVYSKDQVAGTFLKVDEAAKKFLKVEDANVKFLKVDDAANTYWKTSLADATFLKIEDAADTYVKDEALNSYVKGEALDSYVKTDEAAQKYLTLDAAASTYIKGEALNTYLKLDDANLNYVKVDVANQKFQQLADADATFLKITDAANTYVKGEALNAYLKVDATAVNSAKLGGVPADDFVTGDGSVFTGVSAVDQNDVKELMSLERLFSIAIDNTKTPAEITITPDPEFNGTIRWTTDGDGGTIDNAVGIPFDGSRDNEVVQILIGDVVGTLSVSVVDTGDGGLDAFAQILIGL